MFQAVIDRVFQVMSRYTYEAYLAREVARRRALIDRAVEDAKRDIERISAAYRQDVDTYLARLQEGLSAVEAAQFPSSMELVIAEGLTSSPS